MSSLGANPSAWAQVPSQEHVSSAGLVVTDALYACASTVSVGFTLEGCLSLSLQRKDTSLCAGIHTV